MPPSTDDRYDPRAYPRDRSLRVGDQERDAVSEILRQRHLEGRLDVEEFQARLERCLGAKTYAELDELIADFPRAETALPPGARGGWSRRPWPLAVPFLFVVLIVAATGGHAAWLAVPLLFFFVVRPLACGPRRRFTRA